MQFLLALANLLREEDRIPKISFDSNNTLYTVLNERHAD